MSDLLSQADRECVALWQDCELQMRRKRNLQILPWLLGLLALLTALAFLWRR